MWQACHDAARRRRRCVLKVCGQRTCAYWISRLAECILDTQKDIVANDLYGAPIVGYGR